MLGQVSVTPLMLLLGDLMIGLLEVRSVLASGPDHDNSMLLDDGQSGVEDDAKVACRNSLHPTSSLCNL